MHELYLSLVHSAHRGSEIIEIIWIIIHNIIIKNVIICINLNFIYTIPQKLK